MQLALVRACLFGSVSLLAACAELYMYEEQPVADRGGGGGVSLDEQKVDGSPESAAAGGWFSGAFSKVSGLLSDGKDAGEGCAAGLPLCADVAATAAAAAGSLLECQAEDPFNFTVSGLQRWSAYTVYPAGVGQTGVYRLSVADTGRHSFWG